MGSVYPSHSVNGGTNSGKMVNITPTLMAEKRAAFTLAVVQKAASTAVNGQYDAYTNG